MKGWLDNFGKADNANDSNVSLPEGFVGLGYNTKGRNYSPAWGGQFQDGGELIPIAQGGVTAYMNKKMQEEKDRGIAAQYNLPEVVVQGFRDPSPFDQAARMPEYTPIPTVPYLEKTKDPVEFFKSWITSPEYRRRKIETGYQEFPEYSPVTGDEILDPYSGGLIDREMRSNFLELEKLQRPGAITYDPTKRSEFFEGEGVANINPRDFDGDVNTVKAHEIAHAIDTYESDLSSKEINLLRSSIDPNWTKKLPKVLTPELWSKVQDAQHLEKPRELRSDLNALRFLMYDKDIYDIRKGKEFTKEDLDKAKKQLKNNESLDRTLMLTGDENFIKLMNIIAKGDEEITPIAMGGMSIPGSVGFTYARTAGSAPSKGKYAKKTMASAQIGKNIEKDETNIDTNIANKIAGLELKQNPEYQYWKYLQGQPQLKQAPGRGEELMRQGLGYADVVTDVMQMGNFIPLPQTQTIGKIGNIAGSIVDLTQAAMAAYNKDYQSALINAASAGLPFAIKNPNILGGYNRSAKYAFGNRSSYLPVDKLYGRMTAKQLLGNRALLGILGAETTYDAGAIGPVKKEYGGDIPSAQNGIEKAQLGKYIPSWANPMNWGVADYTDKKDFNSAYAAAKKAGEDEFMFNDKRYSTDYKGTPKQEMKSYGITSDQKITGAKKVLNPIRENLANLKTGFGYDTPLEDIFSVAKGQETIGDKVLAMDFSNEPSANVAKEQDALRLYMGLPQRANTFTPSRYKEGAFEFSGYGNLLPEVLPSDEFIKNYGQPLKRVDYPNYELNEQDVKSLRQHVNSDDDVSLMKNVAHLHIKPFDDMVMGRHTVRKGKDERGEYLEYIDKFDFDTYKYPMNIKVPFTDEEINVEVPLGEMSDIVNKPFDIYGRKYYKDYGQGTKKAMYYTDKELSQLDLKEKNFDTLALQKELSNRGYKLSKSTKSDGTLDGVLGEETKKALADWKKKNKSFKMGGSISSAQNGQEMKFYQNGLDWKPKSMQDGGEEDFIGKATKFVSEGISGPVTTAALGLLNMIKPISNPEIYKTVRPVDYPNALKLPVHAYNYLMGNESEPLKTKSGKPHLAEEFWATAMGVPVERQYLKESKYKPSIAKDPDAKYYTIRDVIDDYELMNLTKDLKPGEKMEMNGLLPILDSKWYSENADTDKNVKFGDIDPLQRFTLQKSPDGSYVSIYDKYDFNNPALNRMMNPIEIYDRFYLPKKRKGGVIKDNRGQWAHPGKVTEIDSNYITMEGVPYDVIGVSDAGDTKLMKPGKNYKFKGKKVTEFPVAKLGINQLDAQPMKKLNQLLNFTNNPDKDNWLDKYN